MFTNPIQTQTQAGASAPQPVVNDSVGTALSAIASGMDLYAGWKQQEAAKAKAAEPEAWEVKEDWQTEGFNAGVKLAEEYKNRVKLNGFQQAETWLNKQSRAMQQQLGYTGAKAFQEALNSNLGKNSDVNEREAELARQNTQLEELDKLARQGAELAAGGALGKTVDLSAVDKDTLIGLAMQANGRKAIVAQQQAELTMQTSQNNITDWNRKQKSQTQAAFFLNDVTTKVSGSLFATSEAMKQRPNEIEAIKTQSIADLERMKSQLTAELSRTITAGGGNIADVDNTAVQGAISQIDTSIKLIRGDYQVQNMESALKQMSLSTTFEVLPKLGDGLATQLMISNSLRVPNDFTAASARSLQGVAPTSTIDTSETIGNLKSLGAAAARANTSVTTDKAYRWVWDGMKAAEQSERYRADAGQMFVTTVMNSVNGNASVRKDANSANGLPVLINELAKKDVSYLADDVEKAAQAEGYTTPQLFIESTSKMFRESVYPSLALSDPYVLTNLNIDYSNGKFNITLNRDAYRQASKLERNIMPHSGKDLSEEQMNVINQRLARMNTLLNSNLLAYKNLGGNPEDIGAAIQYQLQVAAGISKLNQEQSAQE